MQRIERLIEKLKEQYANNASPSALLTTTQLLQNEILGYIKEMEVLGNSGVSVVVPNSIPAIAIEEFDVKHTEQSSEKEYFQLNIPPEDQETNEEIIAENIPFANPNHISANNPEKKELFQSEIFFTDKSQDDKLSYFNHYENDVKFQHDNIRIRDLKKAITENDKKLFIKELFREDEVMYDRSIKTINSFHIYGEAEYWIKRELRTKLGWPAHSNAVDLFEQFIRRRFA